MALTFPLSIDDFLVGLRVRQVQFEPGEALEFSRTAGGDVMVDSVGERLWTAKFQVAAGLNLDLEAVRAKLSILREAGRSLFVYPKHRPFPRFDPTGSILGASVPLIASLAGNGREFALSDLPAGYQIAAGDYLSFTYGSDPVRHAFHQVVVGSVADAGGQTGMIEVTPHLRNGVAVGAAVSLLRPSFKAVLVPGSTSIGSSDPKIGTGPSFSVVQTLR